MKTKGQLQLGKWHFKLGIIPLYYKQNGYLIGFGIFKIIGFPNTTMSIGKENIKGFWFKKEFSFNGFEISWIQKDKNYN